MNAFLEGIKLGGSAMSEMSSGGEELGIPAGMTKGIVVAVCIKIKQELDEEKEKKLAATGL